MIVESAVSELGLEVIYDATASASLGELRDIAREERRRELQDELGDDPRAARKISSHLGNLGWALNRVAAGDPSGWAVPARPAVEAALAGLEASDASARKLRQELRRAVEALDVLEGLGGMPESFAGALGLAIRRSGVWQATLAKQCGVHPVLMSKWVSGKSNPDPRRRPQVEAMERQLGLAVDTLWQRIRPRTISECRIPRELWPEDVRDDMKLRGRLKPHLPADFALLSPEARRAAIEAALSHVPPRPSSSLALRDPYLLHDFGPRCEAQFADLMDYLNSPVARLDTEPGRPWAKGTVDRFKSEMASILGFLVNRSDPRVPPEHLTLALLCFPKVFRSWLLFRVERRKRFARNERITFTDVRLIRNLASMTGPDGWLTRSPRLVDGLVAVPGLVEEAEVAVARSDWLGACARANETYEKFARTNLKRAKHGEGQDLVRPILAMPEPLSVLRRIGDRLRDNWMAAEPGSLHRAICCRDVVIHGIQAQCAFRTDTFRSLDWQDDNLGHLRRGVDGWRMEVPRLLFKNRHVGWFRLPDGRYRDYSRALLDCCGLYEAIDEYLSRGRVDLLRGASSPALFVTFRATRLASDYGILERITRATVGPSAKGGGIEGLRAGFGGRGYRHVLATGVLKATRSFALAGDAIHDSEHVARIYYAKWVPEHWVDVLQSVFAQAYAA